MTRLDDESCTRLAVEAVAPAQASLDQFSGMTVEELAALDPPPDFAALQADVQTRAQAAVAQGCDAADVTATVEAEVAALTGEGEVGEALAAVLRGEVDPATLGRTPREFVASSVTVAPGDDVAAVLGRVGAGSTVTFEPGTYTVADTLVVDTDLHLVGAGREETVIESAAGGLAVAFTGPGGLDVAGLTIRHTGEEAASVLLAIEGPVTLSDVELAGGVAGDEATGGGHGLVFGFEPVEGLPERTAEQRAGDLIVDNVVLRDNAAAGLLATGAAAPVVTASVIERNGTCGVCATAEAMVDIDGTTFDANQIAVQARDDAGVAVTGSMISASTAVGISIDGAATATVSATTIEDSEASAVQLTGTSTPVVTANTFRRNVVGVLVTDSSTATIDENTFEDHDVAIQSGGEAVVTLRDNAITGAELAGISIGETSQADIAATTVSEVPGVGMEITGSAVATVAGTTITGNGAAGLSVTDQARASGGTSTIDGRQVGIQVGGTAAVDLDADVITASAVAGVLFTGAASGRLHGTDVGASTTAGILVGGTAAPTIDAVTVHDGAAGLVVREDATPTVTASTWRANGVGIQVEERAAPTITGNTVAESVDAGLVIAGESAGEFSFNSFTGPTPIGVQVGGTARPALRSNTIEGAGDYGLLYVDAGAGEATNNTVRDRQLGTHLSGYAAPLLAGNVYERTGVAAIAYTEAAGGEARDNRCLSTEVPGIVLVPTATPTIGANECTGAVVEQG